MDISGSLRKAKKRIHGIICLIPGILKYVLSCQFNLIFGIYLCFAIAFLFSIGAELGMVAAVDDMFFGVLRKV